MKPRRGAAAGKSTPLWNWVHEWRKLSRSAEARQTHCYYYFESQSAQRYYGLVDLKLVLREYERNASMNMDSKYGAVIQDSSNSKYSELILSN